MKIRLIVEKKIIVVAFCFLLSAFLAGCAASKGALETVTEKANTLQQKMAGTPTPQKAPPPPVKKKSTVPAPTAKQEPAPIAQKKPEVPALPPAAPKKPAPPAEKKVISPGYTYCKSPRNSFYQAYLSPEWNNNAFKYISIDGLRYSLGIIINYVNDPKNDTIFFLRDDKGLGVELNKHFELEIAFYPPDKKDHEEFKPFKVIIINRDDEVAQSEEINSRMKKYRISK